MFLILTLSFPFPLILALFRLFSTNSLPVKVPGNPRSLLSLLSLARRNTISTSFSSLTTPQPIDSRCPCSKSKLKP
ncbi:hypothetical protein BDZ45DRAFT_679449 [Acephala macrosclerotiorum]|nr:hypothetical protein BDZ45DRAFT_679449 [Acephala macrosclerotiorum]